MPSRDRKLQTTPHEDRLIAQLDEPFRSTLLTILYRVAHRVGEGASSSFATLSASPFVRVARTYESPMAAEARYRQGRYLDSVTGRWVNAKRPDDPIVTTAVRPGHHAAHYRRFALLRLEHETTAGIVLCRPVEPAWGVAMEEADRKQAFVRWAFRTDGLHVFDRHWRTLARARGHRGLDVNERAEGMLDERDHHQ